MPSYTITSPSWFSSTQELREDGRVIGALTMLKKWSYALAEARMPDQTVRFGYAGWTSRTLFIQDSSGQDIASVKSLSWWNRDTAVTIDGKEYAWKHKSWWSTNCSWFDQGGREIMKFRIHWWSKADILSPAPLGKTELLLLFFGMYLMKLQEMDAASSGT